MNLLQYAPHAAGVLALLCGLSYLCPPESIRGIGRVLGGIAFVLFGVCFVVPVPVPAWVGWALVVSGVITVICGARKFARRNQPQN